MNDIKENWQLIKETMKKEYNISDISYQTWVAPLEFYNVTNDVVNIIIPTDLAPALNYISSKYKSFFQVTITEMFDHNYEVKFIFEKDAIDLESKDNSTGFTNPVYNINYENANLISKYKFDSFVVGNNNKLAHAAALAVAESPGRCTTLFIFTEDPALARHT